MKQLLIPFRKHKTSLGQLYYDKDPKEAEPEDQPILKDLAVFVSKDDSKLALRCVFFNKSDQKIAVSNGYVLVEISTNDFKSDGVFPIKGKSTRGIIFPNYVPLIPVEDRSQNYEISVVEWQKHIDQSLPLMKEHHSSTKPKIGYFHFEGDTITTYDMNAVSLLFKKAIKWGNKTIEINYGTNSDQKSNILVFGFKSPYGKCRALLMPVFDENRKMFKEFLDKNVFSYNNETEMQIKGILSISKDDFYKPLESIDKSKKAADAQAQRIRILALKYKYAIQQNKGAVEVICIEINASNNIVRHKRELTTLGKGLAYRKDPDYDAWEVYFVLEKTAVNIQRVYNDIGKVKKFLEETPDYDFKETLYSEGGFVGKHLIEFAKTVGWPYKELEAQRETFMAEKKKKEIEEYNTKQNEQKEAEIQRKADTLERVTAIQKSLKDGKKVTFFELIELIKNSTMKVSPRTMGAIYNQNDRYYIGTSEANLNKKTSQSTANSIFEIVKLAADTTIQIL